LTAGAFALDAVACCMSSRDLSGESVGLDRVRLVAAVVVVAAVLVDVMVVATAAAFVVVTVGATVFAAEVVRAVALRRVFLTVAGASSISCSVEAAGAACDG